MANKIKQFLQSLKSILFPPRSDSYIASLDLVGKVSMANVQDSKMTIMLEENQQIETTFPPKDEALILSALQDHRSAKVRLIGQGIYSKSGSLQKIESLTEILLLPNGEVNTEKHPKPIWQIFEEKIKEIPEEEFDHVPADAAAEHDHYLYGTPKKNTQ